jgi:hypothetical protein
VTDSGVRVNDGIALSFQGDVALVLWKAASRAHRLVWLRRELDARPDLDSFVVCQLILPTSNPPDGPANAEAKRLLKAVSGRMRRIVSTALGDTMWVSIVRAVMRGMVLVTGQSHVAVIASTVPEALGRVHEVRSEKTPSGTALLAACMELAQSLDVTLPGLSSGLYAAVDPAAAPTSKR